MIAHLRRTFRTTFGNNHGVGFVEIMISVTIVAGLAVVGSYYAMNLKTLGRSVYQDRYNCNAQATSLLSKLIAQGQSIQINTAYLPHNAAARVPPVGNPARYEHTSILPDAAMWPTSALYPAGIPILDLGNPLVAGTPLQAFNALMIDGPIRTLNALYNYNNGAGGHPDICHAFNTTVEFTALAATTYQLLTNNATAPVSNLRIQPYDLNSGAIVGCPGNTWIRPQGIQSDAFASGTATEKFFTVNGFYFVNQQMDNTAPPTAVPMFGYPAGVTVVDNEGLLVQVQTTYKDENGLLQSCTASQQLAYDRDFSPPPAPIVTVTIPEVLDGSAANHNNITLTITQPMSEGGVVLACRDRSVWMPTTIPADDVHSFTCYSPNPAPNMGPGTQRVWSGTNKGHSLPDDQRPVPWPLPNEFSSQIPLPVPHVVGITTTNYSRPPSWVSNFVPCERVTLCGSAPSSALFTGVGTSRVFTNTYANVLSDCIVRIDVSTIDTAGNLHVYSPTSTPTSLPAYNPITTWNPSQVGPQLPLATPNTLSTAPRPTCGFACGSTTAPQNPYWQTGACCVIPAPGGATWTGPPCQPGMVAQPTTDGTPTGPPTPITLFPDVDPAAPL